MILNLPILIRSKLVFFGLLMCLAIGLARFPLYVVFITGALVLGLICRYLHVQNDLKHKLLRHLRRALPDFQSLNTLQVLNFSNSQEYVLHEELVHEENFSLWFTTQSDFERVEFEVVEYFESRGIKICSLTDTCELCKGDMHTFIVHDLRFWSEVDYLIHINCPADVYRITVSIRPW